MYNQLLFRTPPSQAWLFLRPGSKSSEPCLSGAAFFLLPFTGNRAGAVVRAGALLATGAALLYSAAELSTSCALRVRY